MKINLGKSLQDTYAPQSICFGCGPVNEKGLRIKSFLQGENNEVAMEFIPEAHHEAFPGVLNGGIIGTLLDCHSNWTAAYTLLKTHPELTESSEVAPCTVTADFHVKLRAPTPSNLKVRVKARATEVLLDRAKIEAQLYSVNAAGEEKLTATCTGTFVAVKPGHPAYHRWENLAASTDKGGRNEGSGDEGKAV